MLIMLAYQKNELKFGFNFTQGILCAKNSVGRLVSYCLSSKDLVGCFGYLLNCM